MPLFVLSWGCLQLVIAGRSLLISVKQSRVWVLAILFSCCVAYKQAQLRCNEGAFILGLLSVWVCVGVCACAPMRARVYARQREKENVCVSVSVPWATVGVVARACSPF